MNNKGFTMVELLAVVALICVLSGTALLAVTRYVSSAQKKTYKNYESNLKGGAVNYLTTHTELASLSTQKIYATDLIQEGYLEDIEDPVKKGMKCNTSDKTKDSYIIVEAKRKNEDDNNFDYNLTFTYKVCLICDSYKSSGC